MESRRDFIKKAALLSGALGLAGTLPSAIQKALAINPDPGTTWKDAEHVVILMQENRSFDHLYGTLQGVRGFNDPRAITLPNSNPVWLQTNKAGETYAPFRLNIKDTRATWMGSLPHSWTDQVDTRNEGKMDRWLDMKASGHPPFAQMPLTMGYYNREDLPFYYSLADAFTICDQNFCSSLTGTTPNRLHLWTGTIREAANEDVFARVNNENADYDTEVGWTTFPERLEEAGVSWKVYQNELSVGSELAGEEDQWLSNFGDNPIEYFTQFNVRFHPAYTKALPAKIQKLKQEISAIESSLTSAAVTEAEKMQKNLKRKKDALVNLESDREKYTLENYARLSAAQKSLHERAFVTNTGDPDYHQLQTLTYEEEGKTHSVKIPKGDVFHQFREDVNTGKLPTVSWLVAPENLSDHPTSPWYGAAYVSEAMDILTDHPEVWKKTIFILCYDENDGYFDHFAPFTAPYPGRPETGFTSAGIDTRVEYVKLEQDKKWKPASQARESSIGLGYRVPLVIASPWSRGGAVNSQVCDHTSILQFLEKLLSHQTGKKVVEPNISEWRRTVCGDLTSVFTPWTGEAIKLPDYLSSEKFYGEIHQAQFKKQPGNFRALTADEIAGVKKSRETARSLTRQEKGVRVSRALPYELYSDAKLSADGSKITVTMKAGNGLLKNAVGSPFSVYAHGLKPGSVAVRNYAVRAGDELEDSWALDEFSGGLYHLKIYGPNGFFREFTGTSKPTGIDVKSAIEFVRNTLTGNFVLTIRNQGSKTAGVGISDESYNSEPELINLKAGESRVFTLNSSRNRGWYDYAVRVKGHADFVQRYAGRVEIGKDSVTDLFMGG